ncbi:receptor-type guanylate cyclase gcy-5-like [Mya arenaria]|uniref:receptor-type guanylate cyclase gcy-5-like n=1 Tax=Mya arenaria TaxID=6604 RepID=UPI0022E55F29|nr:receptor-type guanylate cyclase gcy-5-like [Mya arenaria]
MPWWSKSKGTIHPAKVGLQASISGSTASMTPSQLDAAIMNMLSVNNTGNRCQNACRGDPITTAGQRNQMIKMLAIILIPVLILVGLTGNSFGTTLNNYLYSNSIRSTLLFSLDMAYMIRALQRERDGSALYLSSIRPETKGFLLERYQDTDEAVQTLPYWPSSLSSTRSEFDSSETFLKTLNRHRYELDTLQVTFHDELMTYSEWIEVFIKWFYKSITEARAEKVWKAFVAYQELLVASEYLGRERAMGVIFYTLGEFPTREEYLYFVESQDTSNASFAAARQYSQIAKEIYDAKIKDNPEIMQTIKNKRAEIRSRNTGADDNTVGSLDEAKYWFENMTYFQDIIKEAQVSLALTIDGLLEARQKTDLTNIIIICIIFSAVLILCPIIIYAVYSLTVEIQRCSIHIADRTKALSKEKKRTDTLLYQMLPKQVAEQLKQNQEVTTEEFVHATIMFSDIVGFTQISSRSSPLQIVEMLNMIYSCLDDRIEMYDVYKVETIGDAYLVVSGVPNPNGKLHASEIASLSIDILEHVHRMEIPHIPGTYVKLRIGCHSGSVVAGVVGTKMPHYCVFGEAVNVASKMEALGKPSKIHLSDTTANILTELGGFVVQEREDFAEKGDHDLMMAFKGIVRTFWLVSKEGFAPLDLDYLAMETDITSKPVPPDSPVNDPKEGADDLTIA